MYSIYPYLKKKRFIYIYIYIYMKRGFDTIIFIYTKNLTAPAGNRIRLGQSDFSYM